MEVREYLNKNPLVAAGIAGASILFVIVMIWRFAGGTLGSTEAPAPKRFFTTDDGKTYYPDTVDKVPPFTTPDNKVAYRAHVLQCGTGQPFVAYVAKYSDPEKQRLEKMFVDGKSRSLAIETLTGPQDQPIVKRPLTGDTGWVQPTNAAQYEALVQPICPGGGTPQPVYPK